MNTKKLLPAMALIVITVAAYLPVTRNGYIWDDETYITGNETLRTLDGLSRIWFEIGAVPQYYPLVHTSFWIEYQLWGLAPTGYHIVNVLLHAIGAILLWLILSRLSLPASWMVAAVFALHPVHVESVAWITERKNVLSGCLYLASFLTYLIAREAGGSGNDIRRSRLFYGLTVLFFVGALLSKTVTASLPAALMLALYAKGERITRTDLVRLIPLFLVGASLGLLTVWMEKTTVGADGIDWELSFLERSLLAGRALCFYLSTLLVPTNLAFVYPRWGIDAGAPVQYIYPAIILILLVAAFFLRKRFSPIPLCGFLFFGGTLLPAIGFLDVFPMIYSFVANHFQYLASIGPMILIVAGFHRLCQKLPRTLMRSICALTLILLGGLSYRHCLMYRDLETLWRGTLVQNPQAWLAWHDLGQLLQERGDTEEAIECYEKALAIRPETPTSLLFKTHYNLGVARTELGLLLKGIDSYQEALRLRPDRIYAHNALGLAYLSQGKFDLARQKFLDALRLDSSYAPAFYNLGNLAASRQQPDQAIVYYRQAISCDPAHAASHQNLGMMLLAKGQFEEAIQQFDEAERLNPDQPVELLNRAFVLATHPEAGLREAKEALSLAQRCVELTEGRNAEALDALAAAQAAAGQFQLAVTTARSALSLAESTHDSQLTQRIRSRLELYQAKKPYRSSLP